MLRVRIALLGKGAFAHHVKNTLNAARANVYPIFQEIKKNDDFDRDKNILKEADALVVVEHHEKRQLIGDKGLITGEELSSLNDSISVIHICGNVDQNSLLNNGVECWPKNFAPVGYMSVGTDYIGPDPLIKLHTAGLKVGEHLACTHKEGKSAFDTEMEVLAGSEIAQGFKGYHFR